LLEAKMPDIFKLCLMSDTLVLRVSIRGRKYTKSSKNEIKLRKGHEKLIGEKENYFLSRKLPVNDVAAPNSYIFSTHLIRSLPVCAQENFLFFRRRKIPEASPMAHTTLGGAVSFLLLRIKNVANRSVPTMSPLE
jgi:hypothetical protein